MPRVNLDDVEPWKGDGAGPTPDGSYRVSVKEIEERTSQGAAGDYWNVRYEIEDGPYGGRALFDNIFFTDKSLGRLRQILEALGVTIKAGNFNLTPSMVKGKKCHVLVRREEYVNGEGETDSRPEVKAYSAEAFKTADAPGGTDLVREAAAKLGATAVDDDDIPFAYRDDFSVFSI